MTKSDESGTVKQEPTEDATIAGQLVAPFRDLSKPAGLLLGRVTGAAADGVIESLGNVYGGFVGDKLRHWRNRNLVDTLEKTAAHLRAKGIPLEKANALPNGELYELFDEASKSDDPNLQSLWASLLSNASNPEAKPQNLKAFIRTLGEMSGADARLLEFINDAMSWEAERSALWATRSSSDRSSEELAASIEERNNDLTMRYSVLFQSEQEERTAIVRLQNLNCIAPSMGIMDAHTAIEEVKTQDTDYLTHLSDMHYVRGREFSELIDEIVIQIAELAGMDEFYEERKVIDVKRRYRMLGYKLTEFGRMLVERTR